MAKILLLSHHRSGSTFYVESINSMYKKKFPQFFPCISEVYSEEWKIRPEYMKHFNLFANKFESMDCNTLSASFLHAFRLENFIIKYFPYSIKNFCSETLTQEYIMQKCIDNGVEVHFLYRKNLLQCAVSYLISKYTNIWHNIQNHNVVIDYHKIFFEEKFIDDSLNILFNEIDLCHKYHNEFLKLNLIKKKLTYEDDILSKNFTSTNCYKKLNNDKDKEIIISNNPKILEYINKYIKENKFNCAEEFILKI